MERDCIISHGASHFLRERLFTVSDPFQILVCQNCGVMASKKEECQSCRSDQIITCNIPYASKLLSTELAGIGLKMDFVPEQN